MSIIIGNGVHITYDESEVRCPICTAMFDAGGKMEKAKYPVFKMKCPNCKGLVGISVPIFGGNTKCYEWNPPKIKDPVILETETPFKVNGKVVVKKPYDDNSRDEQDGVYI
jgi:hypothetical protein